MKTCPQCNEPNPDKLNFCGYCGTPLKEEAEIDEVAKLHNKLAETEEEKRLYKEKMAKLEQELKEKEAKKQEVKPPVTVSPPAQNPVPPKPQPITAPPKQKSKAGLIAVLLVLAVAVFGSILYFSIIQPYLVDKDAARYFSLVGLNFRSSKDAGGDYNKIASIPYGAELITYEHGNDWSYVKYDGKKGYVSSDFVIDKADFLRLNSIFGDTESKGGIATAKCRLALLNYFKEKGYIGSISSDVLQETMPYFTPDKSNQWQVFCRDFKLRPNNVLYPKLYNQNSKFTDFAVIIKNINTGERRLLIFYFDDDETSHLYYEEPVYSQGYIRNIKTEYDTYSGKYIILTNYSD